MKHLIHILIAFIFLIPATTKAQHPKGDFNSLDIWGGIPTTIISSWFDGSHNTDTFNNGTWATHNGEQVIISRDSYGRIQNAFNITYSYDHNGIVNSLQSADGVQRMENWNNFNIGAEYGSSKWQYVLTKFNSHGDWTEREMSVNSNGQIERYSQTRKITYTDEKNDNSLTVLGQDLSPLIGCVLFVCDKKGNKLDFIRGFVSDIDGKFHNLPFSDDITYRLEFIGYNEKIVDANPNAVVVMK